MRISDWGSDVCSSYLELTDGGQAVGDGGATLEVAPRTEPVPGEQRVGGGLVEHLTHLVGRPDVELALLTFAVGVLGRGHAAGRLAQVAQHVLDGLGHHLAEAVGARELDRKSTRLNSSH